MIQYVDDIPDTTANESSKQYKHQEVWHESNIQKNKSKPFGSQKMIRGSLVGAGEITLAIKKVKH